MLMAALVQSSVYQTLQVQPIPDVSPHRTK